MTRDDAIALKIINKAMQNVKNRLEPLTYAVNILTPRVVEDDMDSFMTDSQYLYFNSRRVLYLYHRGEEKVLEYQLVHILLHGILGHFSDTGYVGKKLAWRVMDLSVEQIMDEIGMNNTMINARPAHYNTIGMSLYHHAMRDAPLRKKVLRIGLKRQVDDHELWWKQGRRKSGMRYKMTGEGNEPDAQSGSKKNSSSGEDMVADKWDKAREYLLGNHEEITSETLKHISEKLKTRKGGYGSETGSESKCVRADSKNYSFHEVFKEFLQNKAISKDQPDFHDQMLYQYGLDMYENIPLIEPLDEIEDVQLSNLVIAIDTSGSCEEYVGIFLSQIMSIFKDISTHYHFEKIFLMQCDASIKNVCEFSEIEELEEVNETMKMYGFGGTSFVPVFRWIEKNLTEKGEQVDCLLYLSDGEGSFPMKKTEYPVFFIIPGDARDENTHIPEWIRQVSIDSDNKEEN